MIYRIGDRDPVTGLYDVIWPDGSFTRNGVKIFNSAHEFGDVVLATQRSDGMMILDGVKATVTEVVNTSFTLGGFGEKPVGYLNGQVFNNEDEVILPIVSADWLAPTRVMDSERRSPSTTLKKSVLLLPVVPPFVTVTDTNVGTPFLFTVKV